MYLIFQILSFGCLLFFLWFFGRSHQDLLTLAIMSPPLIANFILGQDVMLLVGLLTLTILLVRKGDDFPAGLVLSLCAIKPHLFLLIPAAVLFHRRWKILQGAAVGGLGFGRHRAGERRGCGIRQTFRASPKSGEFPAAVAYA